MVKNKFSLKYRHETITQAIMQPACIWHYQRVSDSVRLDLYEISDSMMLNNMCVIIDSYVKQNQSVLSSFQLPPPRLFPLLNIIRYHEQIYDVFKLPLLT